MQYGSKEHTIAQATPYPDDTDAPHQTTTNYEKYIKSEIQRPMKVKYTVPHRVANELEEFAEYHKRSKEFHGDPSRRNLTFSLKFTGTGNRNGYYYVVESYTKDER